jgi:hypothetical protein
MSSNEPRVLIKDGPSKWDLSTNFFTPVRERRQIEFITQDHSNSESGLTMPKQKVALHILWIGLESGDAENFLIKGTMNKDTNFTGYYCTRTRTGWLKF